MSPDFIILAGFMRILGDSIISNWEGQIINIHPLIAKYPGLNTHKRVLDSADKFMALPFTMSLLNWIAGQLSDKSRSILNQMMMRIL
ncbi:MAG: hypothetical protein CM15mP12_8430 [Gammaproteobacteria bacterium]|nr:MAG: hypothetical protein CM15mP12_8430 [Gammaproteobacteria bacterium]